MKFETLKKQAMDTIDSHRRVLDTVAKMEKELGKDREEFTAEESAVVPAGPSALEIMDARRMLKVVEEAEAMTTEEIERLKEIPVYATDYRVCGDIREKYGFSWSELKMIRGCL